MNRAFAPTVGANAGRSRQHNRQLVLGDIRLAGAAGRAEIARRSGLSTQAVSNIIAELEADGLIEKSGRVSVGRGLPAFQYTIRPSGAFALGFEIRPDALFGALLGLDGELITSARQPLEIANPDRVQHELTQLKDTIIARGAIQADRLIGAGVVLPGPFDRTGVSGANTELPEWQKLDVQQFLTTLIGLPTLVENDANAAVMAERVAGVGRDHGTHVFLYFGAGLGLGVINDGRLMRGAYGNAGEIGHISIAIDGSLQTFEDVAGRLALRRYLERRGVSFTDSTELANLFQVNQPDLMDWLDRAGTALSQACGIIENLFDPATIVLGGAMPDCIIDHLITATHLSDHSVSNRPDRAAPRLMRGGSGSMTATLGAAALVIAQTFTPQIADAA